MNDLDWIRRIRAGDMQSFSCLVAKYERMAFTIAYRIVGNREDAEEVVQDAFLKMYRSLAAFQGESKFSSWFYRIVYRTAIDSIRGRHFFEDIGQAEKLEVSQSEQESAEAALELRERREMVSAVLKRLPASESLLLTLYYLEECSVEEIGTITGLSESNVKTRLFRGRKHFYELLDESMKTTLKESYA